MQINRSFSSLVNGSSLCPHRMEICAHGSSATIDSASRPHQPLTSRPHYKGCGFVNLGNVDLSVWTLSLFCELRFREHLRADNALPLQLRDLSVGEFEQP